MTPISESLREAGHDRVVIAETVPFVPCQHHTGYESILPYLWHEKAVAVVRDRAISGPPKRLVQGLIGVGYLPAIEYPELVGQSRLDRQILFAYGPF